MDAATTVGPNAGPTVKLTVNGREVEGPSDGRRLLDWLRDDLGVTSVKAGCEMGHCGACTVLLDGRPVLACTTLTALLPGGSAVSTAEHVADAPIGRRLVEEFVRCGAAQCGFCTPGMLCASSAYLTDPGLAADVRAALAGNVCRCTGYAQIVEAVEAVRAAEAGRARDAGRAAEAEEVP